jgi:membrane dipeptidase
MLGSREAHALHAQYPPIDLHADTLTWVRILGYDMRERHEPPLWGSAFAGHVDLPRLRDAHMGAQFFGLVSLPLAHHLRGLARVIHDQIDLLEEAVRRAPNELRIARTAGDVEACRRDGVIGALLGIEGAHALEGRLDRVDEFARRGVRYLGFLHFSANEAGYPAYGQGRRDDRGLTPFGFDLVRRCEAARVLVDLSHINRRGFLDACSVASKPPIVSHTGVLGAHRHWRNIDDDQLRAVADKGGIIGVIFYPRYLGGGGLEPVVRHLLHIVNVVGEDAPALGSDWDGMIIPTRELRDPRGLPLLTDALLKAGLRESTVAKILRANVMRVLAEA